MNQVVRISHALLKSIATVATHQAKAQSLVPNTNIEQYAYRGLLNTSYSYAAWLKQEGDEEVFKAHQLPEHHLNFITEGVEIKSSLMLIENVYSQALTIATFIDDVIVDNFEAKVSDEVVSEDAAEIEEVSDENIASSSEVAAESTDELLLENSGINIPKNILAGLKEQGFLYVRQLKEISLDDLKKKVKMLSGGNFHVNKCESWKELAESL